MNECAANKDKYLHVCYFNIANIWISVTQSYYRGAAGALLVFDISNRASYNNLSKWLSDARSLAHSSIVIFLVGTKTDLESKREVSFMEASQFALENDMKYLETSALNGSGIDEVFLQMSKGILSKLDAGLIDINSQSTGVIKGNKGLEWGASPEQVGGTGGDGGCGC